MLRGGGWLRCVPSRSGLARRIIRRGVLKVRLMPETEARGTPGLQAGDTQVIPNLRAKRAVKDPRSLERNPDGVPGLRSAAVPSDGNAVIGNGNDRCRTTPRPAVSRSGARESSLTL